MQDFKLSARPAHKVSVLNAQTQQEQTIESGRIISFYRIQGEQDFFDLYRKNENGRVEAVRVQGDVKEFYNKLNGVADEAAKDRIKRRILQDRNDRTNDEIGRLDESHSQASDIAEAKYREAMRELEDDIDFVSVKIADANILIKEYPHGEEYETWHRGYAKRLNDPQSGGSYVDTFKFIVHGRNGLKELVVKKMNAEEERDAFVKKREELTENRQRQIKEDEANYIAQRDALLAQKTNKHLSEQEQKVLINAVVQYQSENSSGHKFISTVGAYERRGASVEDKNAVTTLREGKKSQHHEWPDTPEVKITEGAYGPLISVRMPR